MSNYHRYTVSISQARFLKWPQDSSDFANSSHMVSISQARFLKWPRFKRPDRLIQRPVSISQARFLKWPLKYHWSLP